MLCTGIKHVKNHRKFCDVASRISSAPTATATISNVKSYDSIPGPKGIFGIGTLYQYWPTIGNWGRIRLAFSRESITIYQNAEALK